MRRLALGAMLLAGALGCASTAPSAPRVCVLGEGERAHGDAACASHRDVSVALAAAREETAAFQIVIEDPGVDLDRVTIDAPPFRLAGAEPLPIDVFVEHFVPVRDRSRNARDRGEALPFTAEARSPDADAIGLVPDALIPLDLAACEGDRADRAFCPYPLRVAAGGRGAFWLDVFVPRASRPGRYTTHVTVRRKAEELASWDVSLDVAPAVLPFEATGVFAFEAFDSLEERFGDPVAVEASLLQLLHAHHVDGFPQITEQRHVDRMQRALDGSLFTSAAGYRGPGAGAPLSILPLGAYGSLGKPTEDAVVRAKRLAARLPKATETFVYAVDEECASSRGADWIKELERLYVGDRLKVAQTCDREPINQRVDIVMTPAQAFDRDQAALARKPVYAYNGRLPWAGPLMLDAPLTSLTADGWLAVQHGVPRWFFWETIFWNDGNRGGEGPRDVFSDPETFHNADGDAALYDGLLVFPGRNPYGPDLAADAVLPSMRLNALRRGAEDAGLVALAASRDPERARDIVQSVAHGGLSDARADEATRFAVRGEDFAAARAALRAIVGDAEIELGATDVARHLAAIPPPHADAPPRSRSGAFVVACVAAFLAVGASVTWVQRRALRARATRRAHGAPPHDERRAG
ncbi:MAG: DUF4091 domain-containing protein [Polyangiaceae bacterium]